MTKPMEFDHITYRQANEALYQNGASAGTSILTLSSLEDVQEFRARLEVAGWCGLTADDTLEVAEVIDPDRLYAEEDHEGHEVIDRAREGFWRVCRVIEGIDTLSKKHEKELRAVETWVLRLASESDVWSDPFKDYAHQPLEEWLQFLEEYETAFKEVVARHDVQRIAESGRTALLYALESESFKRMTGIRDQEVAHIARQTPIILADPLTMIAQGISVEQSVAGLFNPHNRRAYVDVLDVLHSIEQDAELSSADVERIDFIILKTTVHELVHSLSGMLYSQRIDGSFEDHHRPNEAYPVFFREGMTEKLTNLVLSIAYKFLPDVPGEQYLKSHSSIDDQRSLLYDLEGHALDTRYTERHIAMRGSTYPHYRAIIDLIFERADWAAAGITRKTAEQLAAKAFVLPGMSLGDARYQPRKEFNVALDRAAHKGFMVKLGKLVDEFGTDTVADLLEQSGLHIHSPLSIPNIPSKLTPRWEEANRKLAEVSARHQRLLNLNAPRVILDSTADLAEDLKAKVAHLEHEHLALRGLMAGIGAVAGVRRRYISRQDVLIAAIFGPHINPTERTLVLPRVSRGVYDAFVDMQTRHPSWARYAEAFIEQAVVSEDLDVNYQG